MKQGKNPTLRQLKIISEHVATPSDWLGCKALDDRLELVHRFTDTTKTIYL